MYASVDTQAAKQRAAQWDEFRLALRSLSDKEFATVNTTLAEK